jgi:hypothetical protein
MEPGFTARFRFLLLVFFLHVRTGSTSAPILKLLKSVNCRVCLIQLLDFQGLESVKVLENRGLPSHLE